MRSTVAVTATGQHIEETLRAKRNISDDFMIVYIPPQFRWRIIAFICILWIVGVVSCVGLSVAIPIQLGRNFFRLFTPKEVHDGYSVLAGFYLLWECYVVGNEGANGQDILIPLLTGLFGMILMPGVVFQAVLYFLPAFKLDNRFMFTHIYPGMFVVAAAGRSSLLLGETLASWSQTVRDKEFLVEMRLKNLEPEVPKPTSETHVDESGVELSD